MKIAFYLNVISPHQLPLAREIVQLIGEENFKYVYAEDFLADRKALGWDDGHVPTWCMKGDENVPELIDADLVYTGIRCLSLMAKRSAMGKQTVYYSERWFKPGFGALRLMSPAYRRMARKLVRLVDEGGVVYLPCGIHAARDMARICGLMHGDWRCLFRAPKLEFEKQPGGRIVASGQWLVPSGDRYCLNKMRMWGYFVEPSNLTTNDQRPTTNDQRPTTNDQRPTTNTLRVLWVGRFLDWKCVDTIIRAIGELSHSSSPRPTTNDQRLTTTLDIYGTGPEEARLKKLAAKYGDTIKFHPPVPIDQVRKLMREHDVYVLSSNAYEGWGAVVSEALEEGMKVIGTYEAGSSATILPESHLFHAGDWRTLAELLRKAANGELKPTGIGDWTAAMAAVRLLELY